MKKIPICDSNVKNKNEKNNIDTNNIKKTTCNSNTKTLDDNNTITKDIITETNNYNEEKQTNSNCKYKIDEKNKIFSVNLDCMPNEETINCLDKCNFNEITCNLKDNYLICEITDEFLKCISTCNLENNKK